MSKRNVSAQAQTALPLSEPHVCVYYTRSGVCEECGRPVSLEPKPVPEAKRYSPARAYEDTRAVQRRRLATLEAGELYEMRRSALNLIADVELALAARVRGARLESGFRNIIEG